MSTGRAADKEMFVMTTQQFQFPVVWPTQPFGSTYLSHSNSPTALHKAAVTWGTAAAAPAYIATTHSMSSYIYTLTNGSAYVCVVNAYETH